MLSSQRCFEERSPVWILNIGSLTKIDGVFKMCLCIFRVDKCWKGQPASHNPRPLSPTVIQTTAVDAAVNFSSNGRGKWPVLTIKLAEQVICAGSLSQPTFTACLLLGGNLWCTAIQLYCFRRPHFLKANGLGARYFPEQLFS